ncbi:MAG: trypsin-like peptidase domain-containing protein [Actinomycetota bacterium]|nr:trypsin-like peptidase domain-containing protein [Actinomycetota bacterium]
MVNDPGTRASLSNGRLWTDPREEEEGQPWLAPRRPIGPLPPLGSPEDPDDGDEPSGGRGLLRNALLAAMAIFALIGAGFLANDLLGGDDSSQPAALPVVPGASPADQRSRTVRAIYAAARRSVVSVRVSGGAATASGTGFLIDSGGGDATIVTNSHVVGSAKSAQVRLDDNSRPIDARVAGTDPSTDLAVLKVDADDVDGRPRLALADSDKVQVGDLAIAIGYPFGQPQSVTTGIVSGLERTIPAPNNFRIGNVIQTDAAINPGNSGGPLLDSAGRVIGVNSQIATTTGGNVGIGFAVSSDTMREVVPRLQRGGAIRRAYLGVATKTFLANTGAIVASVVPSGPGDTAGLRRGDVIRSVGGRDVRSKEDVGAAVESRDPGESVEIVVQRGGLTQTLRVRLGTRPRGTP